MRLKPILLIAISVVLNASYANGGDAKQTLADIKHGEVARVISFRPDRELPRIAEDVLELELTAFSRNFELRLTPSPIIDPATTKSFVTDDFGIHEVPTENHSFVGKVVGDPNSAVRVTLLGDALKGLIRHQGEMYIIEPLSGFDRSAQKRDVVVYRTSENPPLDLPDDDIVEYSDHRSIAADGLEPEDEVAASASTDKKVALVFDTTSPTTTRRRLDMGVLADSRFFTVNHDGDVDATYADMEAAINAADELYRETIGVTLRVVRREILTTAAAETTAKIPHCPNICMSTSTSVPNPGNRCYSNADCGSASECQEAPKKSKRCVGGLYDGRTCFSARDCTPPSPGASGTCGGDPISTTLCGAGGTTDGKVCQLDDCNGAGNCCSGPEVCTTILERPAYWAGRYRNRGTGASTNLNTAMVHLFTGCTIGGGISTKSICGQTGGVISASASQLPQPDDQLGNIVPTVTAADHFFTVAHEIGHNLGAVHDDLDGCISRNLSIQRNRCSSGAHYGEQCDTDAFCSSVPDSNLCKLPNSRNCFLDPSPEDYCARDSDCALGDVCDTPFSERICVGGTDNGKVCRDYPSAIGCSPPDGRCIGAPMSWDIYIESGGFAGGFSPCSKKMIASYLAGFPKPQPYNPTASCPPAFLPCEDVDHDGTIAAADALLSLNIAIGVAPFDDLADCLPLGAPNGIVSAADAAHTLQVSTGSISAATVCGWPEEAW